MEYWRESGREQSARGSCEVESSGSQLLHLDEAVPGLLGVVANSVERLLQVRGLSKEK
jgi:hypothetical protein